MATMPELNDAISKAHLALEELDNFDLHSDDPKSVEEFEVLKQAHDEAVGIVIDLATKLTR